MKQPTKFQRWFLGLFGGVPKSDYKEVTLGLELKNELLKLTEKQLQMVKDENKTLKMQISHDPMVPVAIITKNVKLKEIKRVAFIGPLPLDQTESCLRNAVLAEAAPFVKIEQQPVNMTMTATLLLAEVEECG